MSIVVDYFFAPQSPWTYLGHARFVSIAKAAGATVRVRPIDLGRVFPVSGGVQLKDRPKQRQAYRLMELNRFRDHLGVALNIHPKYFPVDPTQAAKLIIAVDQSHGTEAALKFAGTVMAGVWANELDISDSEVLSGMLSDADLPANCTALSQSDAIQSLYDRYTETAIELGVFGAPTYVIDGELFWGQDRLDFVERALQKAS